MMPPLPPVSFGKCTGRPGVDFRAGREQRLHHRGMVFRGRQHQRRLSPPLLRSVDVGAGSSSIFTASTLPVRAAVISAVSPSP